ncbi:pore-forming ESAT-6 family protein [Rhizobium sp. P38BS-XIX]|uniref:pore-forming ESAT-6 family protein n=1 Tax=Rhizobium sp. P38BS-XIX TaxID=2726740 RepID=UPI00145633DD|nr:pore-forming ESAT-6 family protein [Rhizobium sp. P38BS-XIX]NLS01348.1 pore-forming ESAT-6 family protein [Rhizobium sp. P38BS-XIX]
MRKIILTGIAVLGFAAPAFAQATSDQMEMAYNSARNQLGILKYCQNAGHIDGSAVEVQQKLSALIPAPTDTSKGDAAEKEGESGKISAMGVNQDLAASAKAQNVSEKQFCEVIANAVKQAGAQLPK